MKSLKILLSLIAATALQIVQAADLGKKVEVYSTDKPQLGVIYAYDTDNIIVINAGLWAKELSANMKIKNLSWRYYDSEKNEFLNSWVTNTDHSSPVLYPGSIAVSTELQDKAKALRAIKGLPHLKIVLSVNQSIDNLTPTHYLDVGSYCSTHPTYFQNLTSGSSGCGAQ